MKPKTIKMSELQVADKYTDPSCPTFGVSVVKSTVIDQGYKHIRFFRPYPVTADFEYTGGVICYVGIEDATIIARDDVEVILLERKKLE